MAVDTIITRFVQQGEGGLRNTLKAVGSDVDTLEGKLDRLEVASGALMGAGGGLLAGVGAIGAVSLKAAGDVEMVERALTRSLGSASAAQKKIDELRQFAKEAPQFNFVDSARSFQMLQAMGMEADKIIPLMKGVGNAVAAAGMGNEQFQRSLVQIGQLVSKGKVQGEEILTLAENGIPAARILAKELGLTAEQVGEIGKQGITAEQAIAALTRGMNKEFGGAMAAGADTLQGQIAAFQDAMEQLAAAGGKSILPIATDGIKSATALIEKIDDFISRNPELMKYGLLGGAAVGTGMAGYGAYLKLITILGQAKQAKDALAGATKADTVAEAAKAVVAGKEGKAIDAVTTAADAATGAKGRLAKQTGALAKMMRILNKPLGQGASSVVPNLKKGAFRMPAGGMDGGRFFSNSTWNAAKMQAARTGMYTSGGSGLRTVGAFGKGAAGVTVGGAAMGLAGGAIAGVGASNDMQAAGYKDGEAYMYGAATGIGAAGAAMFLPGGPVAVAMAEGVRFGVNKLYNEPLEKRATEGSGLSEDVMKKYGSMTAQQRSDEYFKLAEEKRTEAARLRGGWAPNIFSRGRADDLDLDAQLAMYAGNQQRRKAKQDAAQAELTAQRDWVMENGLKTRSKASDWAEPTHLRSGETIIRIPNRPADNAQRSRRNQSMNPVPRYA